MDKSIAIIVAIACIGLLFKALAGGGFGLKPGPVAKPFMTRREIAMLDILERLFPECRFHAQVSMGALLNARKSPGKARHPSDRNAFSQKIVDFVMQDKRTGAVVALIEVDDSSHRPDRDRARDAMTGGAGYRTVRIGRSIQPNLNEVSAAVGVLFNRPEQTVGAARGIDDRDYMRDRYRKRRGLDGGKTRWNNKKNRSELDDDTPLGSASWVGKDSGDWFMIKNPGFDKGKTAKGSGKSGTWFEPKNQGFDYQKKPLAPTKAGPCPASQILCLAHTDPVRGNLPHPLYRDAKRSGWLPDMEESVTFPASGSVTVNRLIDPKTATSRMSVTTDMANAVIQLYDRETDQHVISAYVHKHDRVTIPVPPGTYRMDVIEGDNWHGPERYFGASTTYETVAQPMIFTRKKEMELICIGLPPEIFPPPQT